MFAEKAEVGTVHNAFPFVICHAVVAIYQILRVMDVFPMHIYVVKKCLHLAHIENLRAVSYSETEFVPRAH